jgi:hypothetical protein
MFQALEPGTFNTGYNVQRRTEDAAEEEAPQRVIFHQSSHAGG